jgi:hypothetical protein
LKILISGKVLEALALFAGTGNDGKNGSPNGGVLFRRDSEDRLTLAASNGRALAAVTVTEGDGLLEEMTWFGDEETTICVPIQKALPAIAKMKTVDLSVISECCMISAKGDDSDHYETRRIRSQQLNLFDEIERMKTATLADVVERGQVRMNPAILAKYFAAGKKLGIPSPEHVDIAMLQNNVFGVTFAASTTFWGAFRIDAQVGMTAGLPFPWVTGREEGYDYSEDEVNQVPISDLSLWSDEHAPADVDLPDDDENGDGGEDNEEQEPNLLDSLPEA